MQYRQTRENHLRQVVIIVIAAGLIGYDLFMLNGHYLRLIAGEASSIWSSIERFVLGLF